jgi:hypothetical protein
MTGTDLLVAALGQTVTTRQPDEYSALTLFRDLVAHWDPAAKVEPASVRLARVLQPAPAPGDALAMRADWCDFARLLRIIRNTAGPENVLDQADRLLLTPRYVHVVRRDTAAQALAYYREVSTGEAIEGPAAAGSGGGSETVNFEEVRWIETALTDWEGQWDAYFSRRDIGPLRVSYEDLVGDFGPTVARVLDFLGLEPRSAVLELEPLYRAESSEWVQHRLAEYRTVRDSLAPRAAEGSWAREDAIFDVHDDSDEAGSDRSGAARPTSGRQKQVAYSCVVDKPPFLVYQSLIWVLTLTRLAGIAPQLLVVHVVEGTDPGHLEVLRSLGVRVVPVARYDERNVYTNKLRQLTDGALGDADTAVLCDCDIAFTEDITPFTRGGVIRGRSVGAGVPTLVGWRRLTEVAGLTRELRLARAAGAKLTWTCAQNLNGGLLAVPRLFHDPLAEAWPRWFEWILDHGDDLAADVKRFAGQVSFGLSLLELELPVGQMPVTTNFPLGRAKGSFTGSTPPFGLHYHQALTHEGRLVETGVPAVDAAIAKVNALLDEPAHREVLDVALRNWQATLDPPSPRRRTFTSRWLQPRATSGARKPSVASD